MIDSADPSTRARARWLAAATLVCITALTVLTATSAPAGAEAPLQVALVAAFGALAVIDLRYATTIAIFELVLAGAGGRWTELPGDISGRNLIVGIVFARAAVALVAGDRGVRASLGRYGAHAVAVGIGIPVVWMTLGLVNGNPPTDVLSDGNGVAFIAFTAVVLLLADRGHAGWLRDVFLAACAANAALTGVLIVISASGLVDLSDLAKLLKGKLDFGGIVGYMPNGAYRFSVGSAIYLPVGLALTTSRLLREPRKAWLWALYALLWADVTASYTRGIWLAAMLAVVIVLVVGSESLRRAVATAAATCAMFVAVWLITLPLGFSLSDYIVQRGASTFETSRDFDAAGVDYLEDDADDGDGDIAGAVSNELRREQARVLLREISERPVVGHGFGSHAEGLRIPRRFSYELGYLDIAFKLGVLGALLFLSFPLRLLADAGRARLGMARLPAGIAAREASVVLAVVASVMAAGTTNPYLLAAFGLAPIVLSTLWLDPGAAASSRAGTSPAPG